MAGKTTRRAFLTTAAVATSGAILAACQPQIVEVTKVVEKVVKETVMVEGTPQVVEKVVKETVVQKEVVEKVVTSTPGPKEAVTIKLGIGLTATTEPLMTKMLAQFQESQAATVEVVAMPPYVGFLEKILTQIAGGTGPDISFLLAYWTGVFGKAGILAKLDDYVPTALAELYNPLFLGSYCQWEGHIHALPLNTNVQGILYNKDHFDKAGVVAPTKADEAWTWDEFSEVCQKLLDANDLEYVYGIYGGAPQGRLIQTYQNGQGIISADLSAPALDTPEAIEAIAHIQSLFVKKFVPSEIWTSSDPRFAGTEMFKSGRISIFHGGQWYMATAEENFRDIRWGVTYGQRQKQLTTVTGGETYAVYAATKVPAEAAALALLLTNEENQKSWCSADFRIPSNKKLLEPGAMLWPHHQAEMDLFIDHLKYGSKLMLMEYYSDGWSRTDTMLRARTGEIATGQKQATQWAQEVSDEIRGFIKAGGF